MSAVGPPLTYEQHQLLQLVLETFRKSGTWPTYFYVEKKLDSLAGVDLFDTGRAIRGNLIQFDPYRSPQSEVMLTIAGIAQCDGAAEDLDAFIATVRWLVACERGWEPESPSETRAPEVGSEERERRSGARA